MLLHCVLYFSDIVNGDLKSVILYLSGLKNYNEKVSFLFNTLIAKVDKRKFVILILEIAVTCI